VAVWFCAATCGAAVAVSEPPSAYYPHPSPPASARWTGTMLTIIGAMFAAAVLIGVMVRPVTASEPPSNGADAEHHANHPDKSH